MRPDQHLRLPCARSKMCNLIAKPTAGICYNSNQPSARTYLCKAARCCLHVGQRQTLAKEPVGRQSQGLLHQLHRRLLPLPHAARWRCCPLRCCGRSYECPSCRCCLVLRPLQQVQELRCCLNAVLVWEAPQVSVKNLCCCHRLLEVQDMRRWHCLPQ
jgi:hypothetical protein